MDKKELKIENGYLKIHSDELMEFSFNKIKTYIPKQNIDYFIFRERNFFIKFFSGEKIYDINSPELEIIERFLLNWYTNNEIEEPTFSDTTNFISEIGDFLLFDLKKLRDENIDFFIDDVEEDVNFLRIKKENIENYCSCSVARRFSLIINGKYQFAIDDGAEECCKKIDYLLQRKHGIKKNRTKNLGEIIL